MVADPGPPRGDDPPPAVPAPSSGDPFPAAVLSLTVTIGMTDAISFLGLGEVFVGMMTGNVVAFGFALGGAPDLARLTPLLALTGFLSGVAATATALRRAASPASRHWFCTAMAVEALLLLAAAVISFRHPGGHGHHALVALLSLTMGIRCAAVRSLAIPELLTTFALTGALISLVHGACTGTGSHTPRRLGLIGSTALGAVIGATALTQLGRSWALLVTSFTVAALTVALRCHPASQRR
ncbi:membrane protein [Streptomyces albospinus]|uniref:Membrane protein n=1 Tax=Streptomyces albospinus TaxID=285515 RepID=A0ABQ2VK79_9ACTN|nr:YoaK family protein [Streptomyces albospinus]GGU88230.1 membrane protein [Streptomyces albospinus]